MVSTKYIFFLYIFEFNLAQCANKKYNPKPIDKYIFCSYTFLFEHLTNYTLIKAQHKKYNILIKQC